MWTGLEALQPRSLKLLTTQLVRLVEGRLWAKVLVAMVLGIGAGVVLGPSAGLVSPRVAATVGNWVALPGEIFLAAVQMIVIPLVFASIIRGLAASENLEQLRRTGGFAVIYFVATSTVAISVGVFFALIIEPGAFVVAPEAMAPASAPPATSSLPEAIVGLIPTNPLSSMVHSEMLGVVVFAAVVGVALVSLEKEHATPLLSLLGSLQQVSMTVVRWAMMLAPLAVFGLMARLTARLGFEALVGLSVYVGTVLLGLATLLAIYVLIAWIIGGHPPRRFLGAVRDAQLLAFSTSSSAAVMPLSIRIAEEKLDVRPSVAEFVIPLGATINMDGTALYQGVATLFLAQAFGVDLSTGQLLLVVVTAVAASIGSPATPGVGIVILATVLASVGVPAEGIGLIIGVDRILDMSRTALNVTGDLLAATVLNRFVAAPDEVPGHLTSV